MTRAVALLLLLGGCAGIPVRMDPASMGRAYVEIQHDVDGTRSTCHVKAAGGMEAKGLAIDARLCGRDGERIDGKADDLSGKDVQLDAIDKWATLSAQQQAQAFKLAGDALKAGGPLACAGVLTATGFPAAAPFCAALAGVQAPPVVAPGLYEGPDGHRRTLLDQPTPDSVRYASEGGTVRVVGLAEWRRWVHRPL